MGEYNVNYQRYPTQTLHEMATRAGFLANATRVEDERCATDLLYALFRRPHTVAERLLRGLVEVVRTKYAPDFDQSRMCVDAMHYLTGAEDAPSVSVTRARVFYTLLILSKEPEARAVFVAGVPDARHLDAFIGRLRVMIHGTFLFPFGETNIIHVIQQFLLDAEHEYVTK
jgi:hypothetical protein